MMFIFYYDPWYVYEPLFTEVQILMYECVNNLNIYLTISGFGYLQCISLFIYMCISAVFVNAQKQCSRQFSALEL
jgi:hypothetical protein